MRVPGNDAFYSRKLEKERNKFLKVLGKHKIILSNDCFDYTNGILNRLNVYKIFLQDNPNWIKKVVLVLVVVPSRIGVEHYQQIKKQIDESIGEINGAFGSIDWTPIIYQYRFMPLYPLVALYSISDVATVTPLRNRMNLIAKEYLACRQEKTGVLILSVLNRFGIDRERPIVTLISRFDYLKDLTYIFSYYHRQAI